MPTTYGKSGNGKKGKDMDEVLRILRKIKDERTHCQCSRAKVVEKAYFERLEKALSALPSDLDKESIIKYLSTEKDSVRITNEDLMIRARTFDYAMAVVNRVYG